MTSELSTSTSALAIPSGLERLGKDEYGSALMHLRPMLTLVATVGELVTRGIALEKNSDDFDLMDIARFRIHGIQTCIAVYKHSSPNRAMVFIDTLACAKSKTPEMTVAQDLIAALDLKDMAVDWTNPVFV